MFNLAPVSRTPKAIRAIYAKVKQEYGWPKTWKELLARGIRVGKERVRKLLQFHGTKARGKRKFVVTTDSKPDLPIAPNLLERNFAPEAPNRVWSSDITYIATDGRDGRRLPSPPASAPASTPATASKRTS